MYYCIKVLIQKDKIIEFQSNIPIYLQLAKNLKVDILAGRINPGDKLPSVRDFALQFQVNPNTAQRALGELEDEGLIYTERTNGKYITNDERLIAHHRKRYAAELTKEYKNKMQEIGFKF